MKLVRWLLSNILLIVIVLVLSYVYVYWDRLTDKDTPAGPAIVWLSGEFKFVDDLVARLEDSTGRENAASANGGKADDADDAATTDVLTEVSQPPVPVAEPVPVIEQQTPDTGDKFVTPEIVASLTRVTPEPEAAEAGISLPAKPDMSKTEEAEPASTRELWIAARRAFHRREFDKSINSYEKLIASTQDNYDAYGELGNVYFNQGRIKEAAASYYDAAAVMVRLGQIERAASLIGLLGRMDTEKARELQELIASVKS